MWNCKYTDKRSSREDGRFRTRSEEERSCMKACVYGADVAEGM